MGTALYFLRSSVRLGAPPFVNNIAIGFRVVRERTQVTNRVSMQDHVASTPKTHETFNKPVHPQTQISSNQPYFRYLQYVNIPKNQTNFPFGKP